MKRIMKSKQLFVTLAISTAAAMMLCGCQKDTASDKSGTQESVSSETEAVAEAYAPGDISDLKEGSAGKDNKADKDKTGKDNKADKDKTGKDNKADKDKTGKDNKADKDKTGKDNKADEDDDTEGWVTLDESSVAFADSDDLFLVTDMKDQVLLLNKDGSVRKVVNIDDDLVPGENISEYSDKIWGSKIVCVKHPYDDVSEGSEVYYYDMEEDEWAFIDEIEDIPMVTLLGDDIYMDIAAYDSDAGRYLHSTVLYKDNHDGTFDYEGEVYRKLNKIRDEENYSISTLYYGHYAQFSVPYCINKYGLVPFTQSNNIVVYDEDGNCCGSVELDEDYSAEVKGFDGEHVVLEVKDNSYANNGVYVYSIDTDKVERINLSSFTDDMDNVHVISFDNDTVFISVEDNSGDLNKTTVYAYDIRKKKIEEVICEEAQAGHHYLTNPVEYCFKAVGGVAYYLAEGDGTTEWYKLEKEDGKWEKSPLNVVAHEYSYGKFGDVDSIKIVDYCPYCDKLCFEDYYEWLTLDSSVKNADKINSEIKKGMNEEKKWAENYEPSFTESDCMDYLHTDSYYSPDSETLYIGDVRKVLSHYLFIERQGYSYTSGAAHGYPVSANLLFDLDTGKKAELGDIFDIPEDDLKDVVASAAKDQFDEVSSFTWAQTPEELYYQVYEEVGYDFGFITYYDSYLTFDFQPYDLAAYAAGTISIKVPYKDLK